MHVRPYRQRSRFKHRAMRAPSMSARSDCCVKPKNNLRRVITQKREGWLQNPGIGRFVLVRTLRFDSVWPWAHVDALASSKDFLYNLA